LINLLTNNFRSTFVYSISRIILVEVNKLHIDKVFKANEKIANTLMMSPVPQTVRFDLRL